ncbi:MAG TPA: DUF5777 family beta-barrel protein [Chitinophagales bacterium]|nr:DUF5777 family beta-barrel protein [Chitinophagales bacterium]
MKYFYLLLLLLIGYGATAQMDLLDSLVQDQKPKREYVSYTFKTTRVLNGHSVETVKKNALDFRVSHRFGDAFATKNDNIHNLFGFDQASDIALIFEYGITDDLTVGTGRMKGAGPITELWNANLKYKALKQTTDFKIPVTLTFFGNVAISSMRSSTDPSALNYFPKGYAGFSHRLSYVVQGLVACKATEWLSVQLDPTFVWRNVVPINDKNGLFVLGFSARAKFNKRMGFVFEYFMPIMKPGVGGREYFPMVRGIKNAAYYPGIHIGLEFETGGHIFHVNFTNSAGMLENDFLAYNPHNWLQGQFRLGFTISRTFQLNKHGGKYWKKGSVEDDK